MSHIHVYTCIHIIPARNTTGQRQYCVYTSTCKNTAHKARHSTFFHAQIPVSGPVPAATHTDCSNYKNRGRGKEFTSSQMRCDNILWWRLSGKPCMFKDSRRQHSEVSG